MAHAHKKYHRELAGVAFALVVLVIILLLLRKAGVATPLDKILGPNPNPSTGPLTIPGFTIPGLTPREITSGGDSPNIRSIESPTNYSTPGIPDSPSVYFGGHGDTFFRGDATVNVDPGGGNGQYIPIFGFVGYSAYANY